MPITRLIFFALLLANVAFFAWRQNAGPAAGHEPQRMQQQIEPDKVQLILPERPPTEAKPKETKAPETPEAKPVDTPVNAAPSPEPAAKLETPAKTAEATLLCKAFSGFTPESAKATQTEIASSAPDAKVALITSKESTSYWVHIPPQTNKAGAEKKVGELKQMGVDDSFIISDDGPNKWAVSLGLFKSKEMADNYLQKLAKQGVRSAKIEVRDKGTEKARLEISAPADALGALAREIKPLANASIGECKHVEVAKN